MPPAVTRDGVRWTRSAAEPRTHGALAARLRAARDRTDSLAAWGTALSDSLIRPYALRRLATLHLASLDTSGAERLLAALAAERSPWTWEAARARTALVLARGDTAGADSLLERQTRREWHGPDRAQGLSLRIELRLALRDTSGAMTFAWQMVGGYPADPRTPWALGVFEELFSARGGVLSPGEQRKAAEVDRLHGKPGRAVERLARAEGADTTLKRSLKRAGLLREMRRFREAREATSAVLRIARGSHDTVAVLAERVRIERDAGRVSALRALVETAERSSPRWAWPRLQVARLLEERGEWRAARADYARAAATGDTSARGAVDQAALRAGFMSLAIGERDRALDWFAVGNSEASRFWHGVTLRRTRRPSGDSLLREVAAPPGYSFYRSAARETLGIVAWPDARTTLRKPSPGSAPNEPAVRLVGALHDLGCEEDAAWVLDRLSASDPRVLRDGSRFAHEAWLDAAVEAYHGARTRHAIRFAIRFIDRALATRSDVPDSIRWSISPWLYPPAYDSLFAAWPESAVAGGLDRALLQAVAWKESHFDPRARSRSDAIGLLQLKRPAVIDVARWLGEAPPSDSALADPALNLRYGAQYLQRQLARFKGDLPLALAAYNAGPTVAKRWTRLRAVGGDALACEEIDYPETQDYVKTILAVRQAYRELRPTVAP